MARYAIIENGSVAVYPATKAHLKSRNPNVSFPKDLTGLDLSEFGWQWIDEVPQPTYDGNIEFVREDTPIKINGVWTQRWEVIPYNPIKISELAAQRGESVRAARLGLLLLSDAKVLTYLERGNPVPQAWIDYRDALRDVPNQAGFPDNVVWPTEPT